MDILKILPYSTHLLNSPYLSPRKTAHECRWVWWVWRALAKGLGKCGWFWRVLAKCLGECRWVWRVKQNSEKVHFAKCEYSPKTVSFGRVLKFTKFVRELPFLKNNANYVSNEGHSFLNCPVPETPIRILEQNQNGL